MTAPDMVGNSSGKFKQTVLSVIFDFDNDCLVTVMCCGTQLQKSK